MSAAPHSLEAEESVLGACLLSPKAYIAASAAGLRPDEFYRGSHAAIFDAVGKLVSEGIVPDGIAVADALEKTPPPETSESPNMLIEVGGPARIAELAALVPATGNVEHHAKIVREHALRRGLIGAASKAQGLVAAGGTFEDALDGFEQTVEGWRSRSTVREAIFSAGSLAKRFSDKRMNPPSEDEEGVASPSIFLARHDSETPRPLRRGSLYVLSGYTGHGKTAAALDFLIAATRAGVRTGYASLEMTGDELTERLISKIGRVPYSQAQTGRIAEEFQAAAMKAEATIAALPFDVLDDEEVDPTKLRQWATSGGYEFLIVDHLHRMDFADRFEIEKTVRSIRNMARRLNVPILLLAQLSRTGDKKNPFPPPTLSSLRETAVIEHEAALVGFVYRKPDPDDPNVATAESRFIVAKNRFGGTGSTDLFWRGEFQSFTRVSRQ